MTRFKRVFLLILDSVGVGAMPDASAFGDEGSDTLGHVAESLPLKLPNLEKMGLGNIRPLEGIEPRRKPKACFGKCALASGGKDTTSGHWEMMGITLKEPFPVYPRGFPKEVIDPFCRRIGRGILGNYPASGTEIIEQLGAEHLSTGRPIVYTSADSVFQIAAHEEVVSRQELYLLCEAARDLLRGEHEVGRVIARPFVGRPGRFQRTEGRRDYAIPPPTATVLDKLVRSGLEVFAVGKIASIFCSQGVTRSFTAHGNDETGRQVEAAAAELNQGLVFANFVDFDMLYGHRNDVEGYARALEEFDRWLPRMLSLLRNEKDLLILASDHGCDPSTQSTDHSREYALLLAYRNDLGTGRSLGTRKTLADIGATIAANFKIESPAGESFLADLTRGTRRKGGCGSVRRSRVRSRRQIRQGSQTRGNRS